MAVLKVKEIKEMSESERMKKLNDLKLELLKSRNVKTGSIKTKQIKKIIARILTINNSLKGSVDKK